MQLILDWQRSIEIFRLISIYHTGKYFHAYSKGKIKDVYYCTVWYSKCHISTNQKRAWVFLNKGGQS